MPSNRGQNERDVFALVAVAFQSKDVTLTGRKRTPIGAQVCPLPGDMPSALDMQFGKNLVTGKAPFGT